jgi:hypothetical protein
VPLIQIASLRPENTFAVITRRDHVPTITVQAVSLTRTLGAGAGLSLGVGR